ncbi:MAG TPA: alpha/beta fold hydrolase [Verrucomicrobiae bacterium]|nr:alpha/beta fold hydrolase [Verrucomicrobiae bacterium]
MSNIETIVLVHGYNKNESDMFTLKANLTSMGYNCLTVKLPTKFGTLEDCTNALQIQLQKFMGMSSSQRIHLVGHSMGGLIIRNFLAQNNLPTLGRCVFIASPNKGSRLADIAYEIFPGILKVYKPLNALRSNSPEIARPQNTPSPEIGIIAGNRSNLLLGKLLHKGNDGRVEVEATMLEGMQDFIVKPYGHKEIHYSQDVAELIDIFLRTGSFEE